MSLNDCPKCYEHICICGYEYETNWKSLEQLYKLRDAVQKGIDAAVIRLSLEIRESILKSKEEK